MARKHFWQFLVTDEGNPIENAQITIYKAGTEDPAFVYFGEIGGGTVVAPQIRSSKKGYFEFWIADQNEGNGYALDQKFKVAWSAVGVSSGYIDHIDVFSTGIGEVTIPDPSILKNKAVSNALATGWEEHKDSDILNIQPIHGIDVVDISDSSLSGATFTQMNKLVSNSLGRRWTDHESSWYDPAISTDPINQDNNPDPLVDGPHGIQMVDLASVDATVNKLVSNADGRNWDRHRTVTTLDEHTQYVHIDGRRDFTAPVGYTGVLYGALGADDFVTKGNMGGLQHYVYLVAGDWAGAPGAYTADVIHNKGIARPPIVSVYLMVDGTVGELVSPADVINADTNTVVISMPSIPTSLYVTLKWVD